MKKTSKLLFTVLLVLSLFAGFFGGQVTHAADATTTDVTINKRIWKDGTAPDQESIQNTGETISDFGGEPLAGVGFTAYDVTDVYLGSISAGKSQEDAIALILADVSRYTANVVKTEQKTDSQGQTIFKNLNLKDGSKDKAYLFIETNTPGHVSVTEKATPFVLAMPIYTYKNGVYSDTLNTNIQIYPKNETQTDKKEVTNVNDFPLITENGKNYRNITTGDLLDFKLTLHLPADISEVSNYSVTDMPTEGMAYLDKTVSVSGLTENIDYEITKLGTGYKLLLKNSGTEQSPKYTDAVTKLAGKPVIVTYKMQLTSEINPDELQSNKAVVNLRGTNQPELVPRETILGEPQVQFGTGGKKFIKVNSQSGEPLEGAQFIIKKSGKFATFAKNTKNEYVFVKWVASKDLATEVESASDGKFSTIGLINDAYKLEETKAPSNKYVLLNKDIDFMVAHGDYSSQDLTVVQNTPKGLLPATGGNGIYVFLIVGATLMSIAYVWFKKSNSELRR